MAKRYVNCNCNILVINMCLNHANPLCNCCNFHVNSRNCFMLRKQKLSIQTYRTVSLYTHTVGITGVGDPHSCCTQRLQNNLSYHTFKLFTYNAHIKFSIFLVILPPMKTNKLINFRLYQFNLIILYSTSMLHKI